MSLAAKALTVVALIGAATAGFFTFRSVERAAGARDAARHAVDSLQVVKDSTHAADSTTAAHARLAFQDSLARSASATRVARAQQTHTDSARATAEAERDAARRLLADSLATNAQLRTELSRVIVTSAADARAAFLQDSLNHITIASQLRTIASAQTALALSVTAENAAIAAKLNAEHGERLARAALPSTANTVAKLAATAIVSFIAGRASK